MRSSRIVPVCVLLFLVAIGLRAATPAEIERKIDALVARMTLEEKLGQMSQATFPERLTDQLKAEIRQGRWGSFLDGGTPQQRAEAQRIATQESRTKIPLIFGQDVIHGYRTIVPIPLGQSASWDPELIRQAARIAAREAAAAGIHWTFAPMMDIARDPRWGRIAESLGEDPYLAGVLAAAMVRGFQGDALDAPDSVAACAKHYVGYGAAEAGRDYNTTWIPEVLLRNVYLRPFHAAREAGVATYMTAFNDLNGVPASGNEFTVRQVLRNEWKFDGLVVSDYTAIHELIEHGYAADAADAAFKGIRAGVDMEMVSNDYYDHAKALIASGRLDSQLIDASVRNILRIKYRLGLFDGRPQPTAETSTAPAADALEIARKLAAGSLVLLKNHNGALPLAKSIGRIAVIGPLADSPTDQMGTWVLNGDAGAVRTPLNELRRMLGEARVVWAPGLKNCRDTSRDGFAAAFDAARGADAVLLFLGEDAALSGEAASRAFLNLPGAQEELAAELAKAGKPIVAVIMAGRPLTFHEAAAKSAAVLYAWHPGTMGGPAIAETLFGDIAPSGRLTVTFPRALGQVPIYYDHMNTGRPPAETGPEASDKYRSKYLDVSFTPEYPFGYGLSYTRFAYSGLKVSAPRIQMNGRIAVSAEIANAGAREADEIVQLYTRQLAASVTRPVRELRAFRRVHLKPGEKQSVEFVLTADDLAFYNTRGQLAAEPGKFNVWIAPDAASGLMGTFELVQ
jgi:beta-glucosidase